MLSGDDVQRPPPPSADGETLDGAGHERALWLAWRGARDEAARQALLARHLPYARVIAALAYGQRHGEDIDFDDYLQLARMGLLEAFERYDPEAGAAFRTFAAPRMRGAVLDGVARMTERQQQLRLRRRVLAERTDSVAHGAPAGMEGDAGELFQYLAEVSVGLALGLLLEDTGMFCAGDGTAAAGPSPYQALELRQTRGRLRQLVAQLPSAEQHVIRLHYEQGHAFDDIARDMELSKGRISQIHKKALAALRGLLAERPGRDWLL